MANRTKISLFFKALATTSLVALCIPAFANPEGGIVAGGTADIVATSPTKLDIYQSSKNAVIEWQSFNINQGEHTQFHQPSATSTVVNQVHDANPSIIFGQLTANGNVVLTNSNGVLFGPTARVDVSSLVASTATIADADKDEFLNSGIVSLSQAGNPEGAIINNGLITAHDAGLVGLVAPHVQNNGIIVARLGRAHLASGDTATVDFFGDGLLEVAVSDDVTSQTVINTGLIEAQGGTIALTAAAGKSIVDSLIIVSGELRAPSVEEKNGVIFIHAEGTNKTNKQGNSTVLVDGVLDVSGQSAGEVSVLGDQVALLDGTVIDASGNNGGGDIKIGGDYLGLGNTPTAKTTFVDDDVFIFSDAGLEGDGGRVIVWSDQTTRFHGNIFARGGVFGGDGGFVETSGKENLRADGFVDLSARHFLGSKGTYLLDPADITIYGNFAPQDIDGNVLHLDASNRESIIDSDGRTADDVNFNGRVATWLDQSGHGNDVSNSDALEQPDYSADGRNGQGVVSFDQFDVLFAKDSDVASLDLASDGLSYFSVLNPVATTGVRTLFSKRGSYTASIRNKRFQAKIETDDPGFSNFGGSSQLSSGWQQLGFEHANTAWNFSQNGTLLETLAPVNNQTGNITPNDNPFAIGSRVQDEAASEFFDGDMAEVLIYDRALFESSKNLLNQYQAAKWDIALSDDGTGYDGYGEFTTRYLEQLSETADVHLQASNSITLDLRGDVLALAQDKSLSLTTESGDITSISGGEITTDRLTDGGNVTVTAGGEGNIDFGDLTINTENGGVVTFNVEDGDIVPHQNFVEPVAELPETVETRIPVVEGLNFEAVNDPASEPSLATLVSFEGDDGGALLLDEEETE